MADWRDLPEIVPAQPESGSWKDLPEVAPAGRKRALPAALKEVRPGAESNAPMATLLGYAQGASLGSSDELGGLVGGGVLGAGRYALNALKSGPGRVLLRKTLGVPDSAPDAAVDAIVESAAGDAAYAVTGAKGLPEGVAGSVLSGYRGTRDSMRQDNAAAAESNPLTYGAANIAGGLSVPMGNAKTLGQAMKAGVGLGLASGLLGSNADLTRGEIGRALFDTSVGGAIGAPAGALGYGAGKVLNVGGVANKAADKLDEMGIDAARKVIQGRSDIAAATRKPLSDAAVREVIDSGAMKALQTTEQTAENIASAMGKSGGRLDNALEALAAEGAPGANLFQVRDELLAKAADAAKRDAVEESRYFMQMAARAEKQATERLAAGSPVNASVGLPGDMPLREAEAMKRTWQQKAADMGGSAYKAVNPSAPAEAAAEAAAVLRRANEDAAGAYASLLGKPSLSNEFAAAKSQFGKLAEANRFAQKAVSKDTQKAGGSVLAKAVDAIKGAAQGPVGVGGAGGLAYLLGASPEQAALGLGTAGLLSLAKSRGGTTKALTELAIAKALRGAEPSLVPLASSAQRAGLNYYDALQSQDDAQSRLEALLSALRGGAAPSP